MKASTVVAGTGEIIKRMEAEKECPQGDVGWSFGPEAIGDDLDYAAKNREQLLKRSQDALIKTQ